MELIAYLDDNREWQKKDIGAQHLSCINYAFANIINGEVQRPLKKIHLINELKTDYPQLKTCISIGGWGADGFSDAVLTVESRRKLIDSLLAYMEQYHFDGVDLDWEYPKLDVAGIKARQEDSENLLLLLKEIRQAFTSLEAKNKRNYLLTIAVGAAPDLLETTATSQGHEYAAYLDYINIMTYDMRGSFTHTTGHHTNLYSYDQDDLLSAETAVNQLLKAGIPKEKLVIGGAFYGRVWQGVHTMENNGLLQEARQPGNQAIDYNELKVLLKEHPENCFYDETAESPYYCDGQQFISYEDQRSLEAKARYVKQAGIRGFMYWEHSLDLSGSLFNALVKERES
ncbi:glycoside hydrolase family 18 protein [uncultured Vagococcus sp.]|uniref:glycoside hydrolase family 18 protein n=1 Tax=uncultured Vagococcus sp. TaxID=189676 RepID=UPI0028D0431A|nr:glycoside hydrolase family 18 protein [uncultured Vagococcus sp.]